MALFRPPVRRRRDGSFELQLDEQDREALRTMFGQLRDLLLADDPDGGGTGTGRVEELTRRLHPPAYADDPDAEAEYRRLVGDDLVARRLAALEVVAETLDADRLDAEQLEQWMFSVNALRLVLGVRLDVAEDEEPLLDPDDPDLGLWALYDFLSYLLHAIVRAQDADVR